MNVDKLKALYENTKDKSEAVASIGTTSQTMYNIIHKGSVPKVDLIKRIANYYKVPVGYFFDEEEIPRETDPYRIIESQQRTIELLSDTIKSLSTNK